MQKVNYSSEIEMAISGKDVQVCMRKVLNVSIKFVWNSMKTHPYVSCTLIFLVLLYTCFPLLFWLLIYLSTLILLVVSIAKIYYRFGNANNSRRDEKNSDAKPLRTSRLVKNDMLARSVRRRRPEESSRDDLVQTSEDEKSTVFTSTFNNGMVDKSALIEEHPKEIREVEVDSVVGHGECSSLNTSRGLNPEFRSKSHEGFQRVEIETESSEGTEEEDDERDREENNKIVQWNEDDRKNLMDLGISEIERNKRLESLIARRSARKLLSLQVRRTLMNMDNNAPFGRITPLLVPRNNPSLAYPPSGQFSPMPGSAPSVLIPMHNPFDIPYDPQEEKPILTGGSFDQEFLPMHQKDMFCRHESFILGPFFPRELKQDWQETSQYHDSAKKQREVHENSKLESQLDKKEIDKIIEVESSQPPKSNSNVVRDHNYSQEDIKSPEQGMNLVDDHREEKTNEVKTKSMLVDDLSSKLSSASSSEEEEQFSRVDKNAILKSLSSPVSRDISTNKDSRSDMEYDYNNSGPSMLYENYENKMRERFFFADNVFRHTPTYSIASDLQVEVSEISSPTSTVEGSISSHNEEVPIYDGRMEGEITSSSEDISAASSHQYSGVDENESRLRDIHEVSENGNVKVSSTKNSEDLVALHKLTEKMTEEAANPLARLTSNAELHDGSQDNISGFNFKSEENYQICNTSDTLHAMTCGTLVFPVRAETLQLTGEVMAQPSHNGVSEKPEQQSYSSVSTERDVNRTYNAHASSILKNNDAKNLSTGDQDSVADAWIQEGAMAQAEWSLTSSPTYIGYTGDLSEIMEEHDEIFAYYKAVGENDNPRISGDSGGESIDMTQHEKLDLVIPVEEHDTPDPNQDNLGEPQTAELRLPGVNERYTGHQASRLLPQLVGQHVPIATIMPSSPRSVLQPKFSIDESSLSHYSNEMHEEIQEFRTPMAENNILNEPRGESLTSTVPRTTTLFMEDPTSHISHGRDAILQELSNLWTTSTEEANFTGYGSECIVHENERGQTELNNFSTMSTKKTNFTGSGSECPIHENERGQNELNNFPESSRESLSRPESIASQLKPMDESSSKMSKEKDKGSEELHEHEAPNAFANQTAQVEHSSMPLINAEEPAKPPGRSSEVTGNPKKNEMLAREMEEKSKDFLKNLMDAFKD